MAEKNSRTEENSLSGTDGRRPTQKDVAIEAGVTQATVSLALNQHPSVSPETRERVKQIAARIGYQPDPFLTRLSAYRKRIRPTHFHGTLAWLSNFSEKNATWRRSPGFLRYFEGATARAVELGYQLEEHNLGTKGMTSSRMERIFLARNIEGILIPPQFLPNTHLDFCFDRFSSVTFGYSLAEPQLHLVTMHHYRAMESAVRRLRGLGYERPGLALRDKIDQRVERGYSTAFLNEQRQLRAKNRITPLLKEPLEQEEFLRWFKHHQPDVVVTMEPRINLWLEEAGFAVPEAVGVAQLSVPDDNDHLSGICENSTVIGAKAVEFLIDLMHRGDRGIPQIQLYLLVSGSWKTGKTVRNRLEGK